MSTSTRLAEFTVKARLEDCPPGAMEQVRRAALDSLGVILAGAAEPVARAVREVVRAEGGTALCTVLGTPLRTSPTWAALANGVAGHAHDFDDTNFALMGHPSVPLLAATLALGEAHPTDGRALALAYVVGFEVGTTVGTALNPAHYTRGWHATATVGTLGCAAAAARMLDLDVPQARHALGIAASLASGVKENFGSMTKPFHAGHAARNGVLAALLARAGQTASDTALDGKQGLAAASGASHPLDEAVDAIGRTWQLVTSGIAVKPYPSCALTHAAIDALVELRRRHGLRPEQIVGVEVGVNRVTPDVLVHAAPRTALERKFSMQFCAASALAEGRVDLASFEDGPVKSPAVRALMARVAMVVDPGLPDELEQHAWARVAVRLDDGRVLATQPQGAQGHQSRPLSAEALRDKFVACASRAIPRDQALDLAAELGHLEDIPDVRTLTARLAGAVEP